MQTTMRCRSDLAPPFCCQPVPLSTEQMARRQDRIDRLRAALAAETPTRCPNCGDRGVYPVFATNRRAWACCACKREFVTGVVG